MTETAAVTLQKATRQAMLDYARCIHQQHWRKGFLFYSGIILIKG